MEDENVNLNVPINRVLKEEYKLYIGKEPLKDAITRIIKTDMGWDDDFLLNKVASLKEKIENLKSELNETEDLLKVKHKVKVEYLKSNFNFKKYHIKQDWWNGCKEMVFDYAEAGIVWDDLYQNWEEIHDKVF